MRIYEEFNSGSKQNPELQLDVLMQERIQMNWSFEL